MTNPVRATPSNRAKEPALPVPGSRFHQVGQPPLAPDLLRNVRSIAMFLYGTIDQSAVRSVYHTIEKSNTLPTFKLGSITCAFKSTIRAKFWLQERRAFAVETHEDLVRLHVLLTTILHHAEGNGGSLSGPSQPLLAETAETIQRVLRAEAR